MINGISVSLIAAVARNNVIGRDGTIPWRIPSDLAFFKRTTLGKPIVMGRKQFQSVGRPLPKRTNIVISRESGFQPDGVIVISSLEAALEHAASIAGTDGGDEVMVIGGGEIYAQCMPLADRLYISHVDADVEGDVYFPVIDPGVWKPASAIEAQPSPDDQYSYRIEIYWRGKGDFH